MRATRSMAPIASMAASLAMSIMLDRLSAEGSSRSYDPPGLSRGSLSARAIAEAVALAASAITVLWVARALGPENLGLLAVALTTLAFAQALSDFGLPSLGAQLVVSHPTAAEPTYRRVTLYRMAIAAVVAVILVTVATLPVLIDLRWYVTGAAIAVLFHPFNAAWLLVALGAIKRAALVRAFGAIVTLAAVVVAIRSPSDAQWGILVMIVPLLASALVSVSLLRIGSRMPPIGHPTESAISLGKARHYALADFSLLTYTYGDRLILYLFGGPIVVGLYDAAHRLIQPFYAISVVARETHFVALAQGLGRSSLENTLDNFVRLMCVATVPIGPFLTLFAGVVVETLYGQRYSGAVPILAILGWTITLGFASGIVVLPFLAWNRGREYGRALLLGNVTNLAVNVLAVPSLGGAGAAVASILSKAAVTVHGWRTFHGTSGYSLIPRIVPYVLASAFAALLAVGVRAVGGTELAAAAAFIGAYAVSVLAGWVGVFPVPLAARRARD